MKITQPACKTQGTAPLRLGVDLDETVFATVDHWVKTLLLHFPIQEDLTPQELVAKYRYAQHVPEWKSNEQALAMMQSFRESEGFHVEIPVIDGAVNVLNQLSSIFDIEYISMRPPKVEHATNTALLINGLPQGKLSLCPETIPVGEKPSWKSSLLQLEFPSLVGIIEDHPGVVESLPADYLGTVFFFSSTPSPRSDINVIQCVTWLDVENAVRSELPRMLERARDITP